MTMRIIDYNELEEHTPTDIFDANMRMLKSCENTDGNTFNTGDEDEF